MIGSWTVQPECIGRVSPFTLPRTIYPQRALTSMLWGNDAEFLCTANRMGHFKMTMTDETINQATVLIDQLLPTYLTDITPTVVIDDEQCSNIRLIFLCRDRAPEVMHVHKNWDRLCWEFENSQSLDS